MEGSHSGVWVFRMLIQCLKKAKSPGTLTHETLTHLGGPHLEGCRVLDSLKITLTGVIRNREHTEIPFFIKHIIQLVRCRQGYLRVMAGVRDSLFMKWKQSYQDSTIVMQPD